MGHLQQNGSEAFGGQVMEVETLQIWRRAIWYRCGVQCQQTGHLFSQSELIAARLGIRDFGVDGMTSRGVCRCSGPDDGDPVTVVGLSSFSLID